MQISGDDGKFVNLNKVTGFFTLTSARVKQINLVEIIFEIRRCHGSLTHNFHQLVNCDESTLIYWC